MIDRRFDLSSIAVRLRDVVTEDLPALYRFQLDPEANRMAVTNPRDLGAFNAHWAEALGDPDVAAKAILVDDELVGNISCFKTDGQHAVGYWIARDHWGRGIATRALGLLLVEVTKRPLYARVAKANRRSIRALERCGFVVAGHRVCPASERFPACEEVVLRLE